MTRVAFPVRRNLYDWLGGLNYLATLVEAVREHEPDLTCVLVHADDAPEAVLERLPEVERHATALLRAPRGAALARAAATQATGRDPLLARLLAERAIDVLSHSPPVGGPVPALSWLPDFQHRHLPELFSRSERLLREIEIRRAVARAERVIVSSADALADLHARAPRARGRVLHFVPAPPPSPDPARTAALLERLGLERFVHLPNQVWAHKNHAVVVEALGVLRERGRDDVVVACTGDTRDYRDPGLLGELTARAQALGVGDRLRMLGRLPYDEVTALMHAAVALLNPSLFEGWSTTVEEAKSIGKRVVLSDIAVHREQDPPDGRYFDPHDPRGLADALAETWDGYDPAAERARAQRAAAALPARRAAFAAAYRAVVGEVAPC